MGFKQYTEARPDVMDPSFDDKLAPEIDEVVIGTAPKIYRDANLFFDMTHPTHNLLVILEEIADVFLSGAGRKVYPLISLFGGGKTHALLAIYHALRFPESLANLDLHLAEKYKVLGNIEVIVISGRTDRLAPSPLIPLKINNIEIKSLWGYIAYRLGAYEKVRYYDENLICPGKDVIEETFRGHKFIILIDELVEYLKRIHASRFPSKAEYLDAVTSFIGLLASTVETTGNVLIITFPVEAEGNRIKAIQSGYESIENYIIAVFQNVLRIAGNVYAPIAGLKDLHNVLKKRLFKHIDVVKAKEELENYVRILREYNDVFGNVDMLITQIPETYPFHPEFVNILWLIADKITGQRTRTAMKIARVAVRRLLTETDENPLLIMPWHIDPEPLGLLGLLFLGAYSGYQVIYENDIIARTRALKDKQDLGYIVALATFLKTYPYDSVTPQPVFPRRNDIAQMIYEPEFFSTRNYAVQDVFNVLEELRYILHHLNFKEERWWFSKIATVKEWIEAEARRLLSESYSELERRLVYNYVKKLLLGKYHTLGVSEEEREQVGISPQARVAVFTEKSVYAGVSVDDLEVPDNDLYKLVAILHNEEGKIRDLILNYRGSPRTYRNTIVAIAISSPMRVRDLVNYLAHAEAAETVAKKINEYYRNYDPKVREIQRSMAIDYKHRYEYLVITSSVSFFDTIYYPTVVDSNVTIRKVLATASDPSIGERVVSTLKSRAYGKILGSLTFESLQLYLNKANMSILPGTSRVVSDIIGAFKTNPRLPMVFDNAVKCVLKEGVENLEIAIIDDMNIMHFKKVYKEGELPPGLELDRGSPPSIIRETYEVLHWKDAVKRLVDRLKSGIGIVEKGRRKYKVGYVVYYKDPSNPYPLRDIDKLPNWLDIVRYGFITKLEEEIVVGFEVRVEPSILEIASNQKAEAEIIVESIGGYAEEIFIEEPSFGSIKGPRKGRPKFKTLIEIDGSKVEGSGTYYIRIYDNLGNERIATIYIRLKENIKNVRDIHDLKEGDVLI